MKLRSRKQIDVGMKLRSRKCVGRTRGAQIRLQGCARSGADVGFRACLGTACPDWSKLKPMTLLETTILLAVRAAETSEVATLHSPLARQLPAPQSQKAAEGLISGVVCSQCLPE